MGADDGDGSADDYLANPSPFVSPIVFTGTPNWILVMAKSPPPTVQLAVWLRPEADP
jgi:hypothetical protein